MSSDNDTSVKYKTWLEIANNSEAPNNSHAKNKIIDAVCYYKQWELMGNDLLQNNNNPHYDNHDFLRKKSMSE